MALAERSDPSQRLNWLSRVQLIERDWPLTASGLSDD